MFHLSIPVSSYRECLHFYRQFFSAEIAELGPSAANVFVFGAQVTFHDNPYSPLEHAARQAIHFGVVVSSVDWFRIRDELAAAEVNILYSASPNAPEKRRGKLLLEDADLGGVHTDVI
jgi:extradiol dioxygenase family protein